MQSLKVCRIRIEYSKEKEIRFISHRDMIRAFERAVRRAQLPIAYSQGFNPHMKISYGPPLKTGEYSDKQFLDLFLTERQNPRDIISKMSKYLPEKIRIISAEEIPLNRISLFEELKK